jgi:hypothetical protein
MGIFLPEDVRVLSKDFAEQYRTLCEEVIRIAALTSDIERIRSMAMRSDDSDSLVFFEITGPSPNCEVDAEGISTPVWTPTSYTGDCSGSFAAIEYTGVIFRMQASGSTGTNSFVPCKKIITEDAYGYDLSVSTNQPCRMPEDITAAPQILEAGTVVAGVMVGPKTVTFCSNMPRLSADCPR